MLKNRIYAIIQTILIAIFIYALINICYILVNYNEGDKIYEDAREKYFFVEERNTNDKATTDKHTIDIAQLKKVNSDIIAWIYIKDTKINYPLLQCNNNQKYLKKTYNNRTSDFGSIFVDFRNSPDMSDKNTIIYGHNTKNGSMFGSLKQYKNINYLKKHPIISIVYADKTYEFEIFSAYTTLADGPAYVIEFKNDEEFKDYLTAIKGLSEIKTGIKPIVKDRIITLSTCTSRTENERFVVHARLKNVFKNNT